MGGRVLNLELNQPRTKSLTSPLTQPRAKPSSVQIEAQQRLDTGVCDDALAHFFFSGAFIYIYAQVEFEHKKKSAVEGLESLSRALVSK
jgi:hypothetical protein